MTASNATKPASPVSAKMPPTRSKAKPMAGSSSERPTMRRRTPRPKLINQIGRARRYDQYRICFRRRWTSGDRWNGGGGGGVARIDRGGFGRLEIPIRPLLGPEINMPGAGKDGGETVFVP